MALTNDEHKRIEALQTEATGFIENPGTSASAAAVFGRVADICTVALAREAEKRVRADLRGKVKASREKRKTQKSSSGQSGQAQRTTSSAGTTH